MPRTRAIPLCLTLFWPILCSIAAFAAEPSPWLEIHSTHYTVITDAGDKKGREVALRFEQMRAVFGTLLGRQRLNQSVPLTIMAFNNDRSYYQVAPLRRGQPINVPGFFLPGDDQDFIVLNLSADESWRSVAHDFAEMLLNYNYPPAQGWFDEGLAEYFSSIRVDNKQVELGTDPELLPSSAEDLLGNQRSIHAPKSLTELLSAQVWLSLPDLFTMKHDISTRNQGTHHTLYYAESWIVIHYLLREQKLPETGAYFDLVLNQHLPAEEAIQKAYGMSSAQLEQAVKQYFRSQTALLTALDAARQVNSNATPGQSYRFPVPVGPEDSAITSKSLPESDARAVYFEVAIRVPERRDLGLQELHTLATSPTVADKKIEAKRQEKKSSEDPDVLPTNAIGNALAHRVLAWALLVGPSTLVPREFEKLGVTVSHQIDDVLPDADVVNLLRIQHERQRKEYFPGIERIHPPVRPHQRARQTLKTDCLIMHPGPINRGVEIDSEIADGAQSVILDQVTNGLAVRMAVLYLCGGIAT